MPDYSYIDMLDRVQELLEEVNRFHSSSKEEIEAFRIQFLGSNSRGLFAEFRNVAPEQRKALGVALNSLKKSAEEKVASLTELIEKSHVGTRIYGDLTRPAEPIALGSRHPISLVKNQIIAVFNRIGFTVSEDTRSRTIGIILRH